MTTTVPSTPTLQHGWRDAKLSYLSTNNLLYGTADPGTLVQLWNDGTLLLTVNALPDGSWHTDGTPLPDGSYHVSVVSVTAAGAASARSPVDNFLVDNHAPAAPTVALDDAGVRNGAPARFSGSAEAGAAIDLRAGQATIASAVADAGGHWSSSAVVADGHYVIVATARDAAGNISPASSTLDFVRVTPDDFGSDAASAGALAIGATAAGTVDYPGDSDWFKVSLETLTTYTFTLRGAPSGGGTLPAVGGYLQAGLQLWDPQANGGKGDFLVMRALAGSGADVIMTSSMVHSGDYYLAVNAGSSLGSYTVGAVATSHDDYYSDQAHATTVEIGGAVSGRLEQNGDVDTFKVVLTAGTTYVFELDPGAGMVNPGRLMIELTNTAGSVRVDSTVNSAQQAIVSFTPTTSGAHYLSLSGTNSIGNYTLKALAGPDDFGASPGDSGALAIGATVHGTIEASGDSDWFAVQLQAGTAYTFALDQGDRGAAAALYLHDASGARLNVNATGFDHGSLLTWTPAASGTYFLDVRNSDGNTPYTLQARLGDSDDHGATAATAGAISLGQSTAGRLELPGDVDWYKVTLSANTAYSFGLHAAAEGLSSIVPSGNLALVDAFGRVQTTGLHGDAGTQLSYQPMAGGDYYVAVSGSPVQVFSYAISSSFSTTDIYRADSATSGTLSPGGIITSSIDFSGDTDWIRVELQAGQSYSFDLTGARGHGGTLATPELKLFDSSGLALISTRGGGPADDPQTTFIPAQSGTYFVQAGAAAAGTGSYTLKESTVATPFADTTPPTVFSLVGPSHPGDDPQTANIVVFLSEAVVPGSGVIALRLSTGELVESFDVATSARLSWNANSNELTIDPSAPLAYGTTYRIDIDAAALKDKAGLPLATAYSANFLTIERSLNVVGTPGNDSYVNTTGSDVIDGGAGIDTVRYQGNESAYIVSPGAGHTQQVSAGWAVDKLTNIERIVFDDRAIAYDVDGAAGQAYRLYQASFDRTPDAGGLGFWIAQMDKGASLHLVAQAFIASAEYKTLFGAAPTDDAFVIALYNNVLHRAPDQGGHDFWAGILQHGGAREDVLVAFSESPENQAAVIGQISTGIHYVLYA